MSVNTLQISTVMDNMWSTSIEKLMIWRKGNWSKYDSKTTSWTLRMFYDVLIISANTKVFEKVNVNNKIKGFYKGDVFILIVSNPAQEVRKIKFQITGNVADCLGKLEKKIPVLNHNSMAHENVFESQYRNIEEVMKNAVEAIGKTGTLQMPSEFNNFVRLCLLDPIMPKIIKEAQIILEEFNKS